MASRHSLQYRLSWYSDSKKKFFFDFSPLTREPTKVNIVTRLNIRVASQSKFRWGQHFLSYEIYKKFQLFSWGMLWFGTGNVVYKYTNQSIQIGLFIRKVLMYPMIFFYLSITVERFIVNNLVVLYLWIQLHLCRVIHI